MSPPPASDLRIAVIGAGPAGLLCALELQDRGFTHVTVLGQPADAQIRTLDVDGVTADVAACYLHCGYRHTVAPLVRRFGLHLDYLGLATLLTSGGAPFRVPRHERLATAAAVARFLVSDLRHLATHRGARSRAYGVPFAEFLRARRLESLAHSFVFGAGAAAQGYGYWHDVSAYSALHWLRPTLFLTALLNRYDCGTAQIREGYGTLFAKIRATLTVVPATVTAVTPQPDARVAVQLADGSVAAYDRVILACTGAPIASPISPLLTDTITHTRLFSFLWTSPAPPPHRIRTYLMHHIRAEARDTILTYRHYGRTRGGQHVYWGVGYATPGLDQSALDALVRHQVETELRLPVATVPFSSTFAYHRRFTSAAVRDGIPLALASAQGRDGIWYSGGLLSHWDINSICHFNRRLVRHFVHSLRPPSVARHLAHRLRDHASLVAEL